MYELGFECWIAEKHHDGADKMTCVAAFTYWQECLDYKDYALKMGVPLVIRTLQPRLDDGKFSWVSEWRKPECL